ncbi:acetate/propionate family kinase [Patescibacteria group bacterium]
MKILVVNAGSSSLKFQLIDAKKEFDTLYRGIADGIGKKSCFFRATAGKKNIFQKIVFKNHEQALKEALRVLVSEKIIESLDEIKAIGHRVVHGGEIYVNAIRINSKVKSTIKELFDLAPLHNPPNLEGIVACEKLLPKVPNVAVFDTAFHQTIPEKAYHYPIPGYLYRKHKIRRYGFHGTSHKYVSGETYKLLKKKKGKIITCHLGNGSSLSAIVNGKCVDTSMGFTPLEGVPMGTRSGSIDPAIPLFLMEKENLTADEVDELLNKKSGILGVSQISSDVRDIVKKAKLKNKKAILTLELLAYKIAMQIGAFAASMDGVDVITFTAGIGQNAWYLRRDICKYLGYLGVKLDIAKNKSNKEKIHKAGSKVKVFVIKTNEGMQIAKETSKTLRKA